MVKVTFFLLQVTISDGLSVETLAMDGFCVGETLCFTEGVIEVTADGKGEGSEMGLPVGLREGLAVESNKSMEPPFERLKVETYAERLLICLTLS